MEASNNYILPDTTKTGATRFWRTRKILWIFALVTSITNIISTFLLYAHYGPLTPNGNRYHHSFDVSSVSWGLVGLCLLANLALLYPIFRFRISTEPAKHKYGIFPAPKTWSNIVSCILTFLNVSSGFTFTLFFTLITIQYITNSSRIMADDLETILLGLAYVACFLFWSIINLTYTAFYRRNW